jgi:hypothetical protein
MLGRDRRACPFSSLTGRGVLFVVRDVVCEQHRHAFRAVSVVHGGGSARRTRTDRSRAGQSTSSSEALAASRIGNISPRRWGRASAFCELKCGDRALSRLMPDWNTIPRDDAQHLDPQTIEVEWFGFGGHIYRRQINSSGDRRLAVADTSAEPAIRARALLDVGAARQAARPPFSLSQYDIYATAPNRSEARVFRVVCGDVWFDIDAANGALRERSTGHSRPTGRSLVRCTGLIFRFWPAARRCAVASSSPRLHFQSYRCRDRVAQNPPIAKRSWSIAKCSWLIKEHLLCRKRRQYVSFSRGLHGRLHMRGDLKCADRRLSRVWAA